jgi:hypothetical protein
MNDSPASHADLCSELYAVLCAKADGLSEYQLIQQLKADKSPHFPDLPLGDTLALFTTHFLLFNALYRLRDLLWAKQIATLHLSPLSIQLLPYEAGSRALGECDPLRTYYLDLSHLDNTAQGDVDKLLANFWTRLHDIEGVEAALELFELSGSDKTLSLPAIKQRYRQLVSLHHPDRGGSTARLQAINKAMEILERYYRPI